jgi:hypothetical protein
MCVLLRVRMAVLAMTSTHYNAQHMYTTAHSHHPCRTTPVASQPLPPLPLSSQVSHKRELDDIRGQLATTKRTLVKVIETLTKVHNSSLSSGHRGSGEDDDGSGDGGRDDGRYGGKRGGKGRDGDTLDVRTVHTSEEGGGAGSQDTTADSLPFPDMLAESSSRGKRAGGRPHVTTTRRASTRTNASTGSSNAHSGSHSRRGARQEEQGAERGRVRKPIAGSRQRQVVVEEETGRDDNEHGPVLGKMLRDTAAMVLGGGGGGGGGVWEVGGGGGGGIEGGRWTR